MTADQLLSEAAQREAALASSRDKRFADLVLLVFGLATEQHRGLMRDMMARVFDLTEVTQHAKDCLFASKSCERQLTIITEDLFRRCEVIEGRLTKAAHSFDQLAQRQKALLELLGRVINKEQPA